ncbi:MAG TPA: MFS transporter [Mycobacteriales bacterium]|nr:MFS transporter [Mycobacteriales bacterium]
MTGRRLFIDLGPLRESPPFRRLWVGSSLSSIGSRMTGFAVILQVFTLTHSSVAVGGVGLAIALPTVALGLFGGAVVDAFDRRRLVLGTTVALAAVSAVFAAQAFAGVGQLWLLYGLVTVNSLLGAVSGPARRTFLPRLLPAERIPAGAALNLLVFHASTTVGPALAGVLTAVGGLKLCYLVDAISFAAAFYGVLGLPAMPPDGAASRPGARAVADGLRFIRNSRVLAGALLADLSAMVLGMPIALFPAINAERFGGDPRTLGLLTAAPAVGGIVGSALSGSVGRVSRQGRAMLLAGAGWGAGLVGFGLAGSLWLALLLLGTAGVADVLAVVFRTAIVQVATPDRLRGRVSAAEFVVGAGCPHLGNFRAGAIASLTSPAVSVVSGGLATVAGAAAIALALPALTRYGAKPKDSPVRPGEPEPTELAT